jgi:hypothetical protein
MNSYDTRRPSKKEKIIKEMEEEYKEPPSHITIKIDSQLKRDFHTIALSNRSKMTYIMTDLIEKYVEEWKKKNEKS